MYRIARRRTYLKQYRRYVNPWDKIEILESDYFVPEVTAQISWRPEIDLAWLTIEVCQLNAHRWKFYVT